MVIWSGLGFVVAVIGFLALVLTEKASEAIFSDPQFYQSHRWLALVAMMLAALGTYAFHAILHRRARVSAQPDSIYRHTLFFVAIKWWPAIFVALGVAMLFAPMR
jgi:hypothetical protein